MANSGVNRALRPLIEPHSAAGMSAALGLAVLSLINLFNYLDRYVVAALFQSLKHSSLALSDTNLGALMSGFLIVYMLSAPVFGALGDRRSRPRLIAAGVAVWSLATVLSGFAGGFLALLAARAAVGVGEAAYGTIGPSLLADYFPAERRGRVMAVFFSAIPIGSALGYVLGGLIDAHFGWRAAFFVAGMPGAVLALLCLRLRDPVRGAQDAPAPAPALALAARAEGAAHTRSISLESRATYRRLLHNRPYVLTVIGYAAYTFAVGGLAAWMPAFLERVRGMGRADATVSFGAIVVITGFIGTFAGGWLGDHWAKTSRAAFLWLCALSTLAAAPCAWLALTTVSPHLYLASMIVAQLCLFLSTGPVNAAIVNLVSPLERASAVALSVFSIHFLGDAISPFLIGAVSDATSLGAAVKIVPVAILVCGLVWVCAARAQERAPC